MGSLLYEAGSSITEHGLSSCDAKSLFVVLGWAVINVYVSTAGTL